VDVIKSYEGIDGMVVAVSRRNHELNYVGRCGIGACIHVRLVRQSFPWMDLAPVEGVYPGQGIQSDEANGVPSTVTLLVPV